MDPGATAVRIVNFDSNTKASLDLAGLERIIKRRRIQDFPTLIVSIGGVARSGKSFLLNLFVNFLSHLEQTGSPFGWETSNQLVEGVNWAQSTTAVTLGIWVWSQPFIIKRHDGSKVAVLLIDSQGTGDNRRSDPKLDTLIMYISLQLASFQIINIQSYLTANELTSLQLCTDYADIGLSDIESPADRHLFETLIFAIRNCQDRNTFGEDASLFQDIHKECVNDDLRRAVQGVEKAFRHITAFTLPHPGPNIATASEKQSWRLQDIPMEFLWPTKDLCMLLFCSSRLPLEDIRLGRDHLINFEALKIRLESAELPEIGTPADALEETILYKAYTKCQEFYTTQTSEVQKNLNSLANEMELRSAIEELQFIAMQIFQAHSHQEKYGNSKIWSKYEGLLISKFEEDNETIIGQYGQQMKIRDLEENNKEVQRQLEAQTKENAKQIDKLQKIAEENQSKLEQEKIRSEQRVKEREDQINRLNQEMRQAKEENKEWYRKEVERHERQIAEEKRSRDRSEEIYNNKIGDLNETLNRLVNEQERKERESTSEIRELNRQLEALRNQSQPKKKKGGCSVM